MIVRVRHRLAEVGLELHNVRDAGYLVDWVDDAEERAGGATFASDACVAS
jgi:hypothetical protein